MLFILKQLPETQAPTMIMPKRIPRNKHKGIGIYFVNGPRTELHGYVVSNPASYLEALGFKSGDNIF
jgi:hypothetical protein